LVVALDTTVTPELHAEGVTRDLVRLVQQARREAGLDVTDRITLRLSVPEAQRAMVRAHVDHLAQSVLATSVEFVDEPGASSAPLDGTTVSWTLTRV
jgi:isoleucyl-tRNA synthetase